MGHWLLTYLLLDVLKKSAPSRIVNVSSHSSSFAHKMDLTETDDFGNRFPNLKGYDVSKLANIFHTKELSYKLEG